ncbi:hypothetical protein PTI45_04018 [Paenibacillus nuruki]|uniref:ABC transporter permease n=1 Tax=Paenibacillus nuruki TaxID=1886670 RepID=A0A1E3KYY1_9BACL|nr:MULTISPECIES: ABC transporter permease [Paenibacillus]ODP26613.1 hypothetical protein PTI45_04018 [Paenibacillus nuruki]TKJ83705.1 ABC transporter permease [Paenibacillus sp. CFBP13512]
MNNASTALKVAAGIFLTIALITIVVILFMSAQEATKTAQSNFAQIQTELSSTSYTVYDNTKVSGSQVLNSLRKYQTDEQFGIQVKTGKNPSGVWYFTTVNTSTSSDQYGSVETGKPAGALTSAQDQSSSNYINPSGTFHSEIIRDKSNVIRAIVFEQN